MENKGSSEKGQALVLLVLGFVVLLGFTALAIDGGMVYADRRHAQNGADASSLAGGAAAALHLENYYVDYEDFVCNNSDPVIYNKILTAQANARQAAITRAGSNDFTIDEDISDNNGVATNCRIVDTGGWIDKYIEITSTITADTATNFAHFVYNGPVRNTVTAITRVRPRTPLGLGYAIVALRPDCPTGSTGGVNFNGNNTVNVYGGGVFSNACIRAGGSVQVYVDQGSTCTGTGCYVPANANVDVSPTPTQASVPLPEFSLMVPDIDCAAVPNQGNHTGGGTINPGRYGRIRVNAAGDHLILSPGLYCISQDFTMNGGMVTVDLDSNGNPGGVTLYMTGGDFTVNGNVTAQLVAPPNNPNDCPYCPPAIGGLLLYMDPSYAGVLTINGTADSFYAGTIYAPSGRIDAGGDALDEINAQLIADTVDIQGNTVINVNVDSAMAFRPPSSMELAR